MIFMLGLKKLHSRFAVELFILQRQLQVVFFDPADFAQHQTKDPGQYRRQDKADQHQTDPVHGGDDLENDFLFW